MGRGSLWGDLQSMLPRTRNAALGHFLGGVREGERVPQDHQAKRPSFPLSTLIGPTQILDKGNRFGVIR